jgi:ribosome biogenesis GTPase A
MNININWYPGHMAKTKRLISEKYDLIDIVYEIIDARIPKSSKIEDLDELIKDKPRILVMTKKDLCDIKETNKWIKYYEDKGYKVLLCDLSSNNALTDLVNITHEITKDIQDKREAKGLAKKEIRALVVGIPNVGKSTLINRMAGRKIANVGNNPGVTKNLSWLKTNSDILLLDSPGILWPKLNNDEVVLNLASFSAIPRDILPVDRVAIHILKKLEKYYPDILKTRYNLDGIDDDYLDEVYDIIGRKIGAIISGGEVDYDRVSNTILEDIKSERVNGITFDRLDN